MSSTTSGDIRWDVTEVKDGEAAIVGSEAILSWRSFDGNIVEGREEDSKWWSCFDVSTNEDLVIASAKLLVDDIKNGIGKVETDDDENDKDEDIISKVDVVVVTDRGWIGVTVSVIVKPVNDGEDGNGDGEIVGRDE